MRLTELRVENLLSFDFLVLPLQNGTQVLVGANGIGKSNIARLVCLIRDLVGQRPDKGVARLPNGPETWVHFGDEEIGRFSMAIELTEVSERALMVTFLRAVAAISAESQSTVQVSTEWPDVRRSIASHVSASLDESSASDFLKGRLVLEIDRRPPGQWGIAYEFDHQGATFHVGICGPGVLSATLQAGPFNLRGPFGGGRQLDLSDRCSVSDGSEWAAIGLADLLPVDSGAVAWNLTSGSANRDDHPLTAELARLLGMGADQSRRPDMSWVMRAIVGRGIVSTVNLRRPPDDAYTFEEVESEVPPSIEDGGALPLELYRRRVGSVADQERLTVVQELFRALTGRRVELTVGHETVSKVHQFAIRPVVEERGGWVPIDRAGAGLWEALVALTVASPAPGQVVILDEPALNMHPTWQRLLLQHLDGLEQVLLITHSPYLVPVRTVDDLARVVRLVDGPHGSDGVRVDLATISATWRPRWRAMLSGSTDVVSALFTRGVILVEGDTELGAFRRWFSDPAVVDAPELGLDSRNLLVLSVDGDRSFANYASWLSLMRIPWAIVCDGPAISPTYEHSLLTTLASAPEGESPVVALKVAPPPDYAEIGGWKAFWSQHGVFSLAVHFGVKADCSKNNAGEIEAFFRSADEQLWAKVCQEHESKVRRGYAFAEQLALDGHPETLRTLRTLWSDVRGWLGAL